MSGLPPKSERTVETVGALIAQAMQLVRQDVPQSRLHAQAALRLAKHLKDPVATGQARRMIGHVHLLSGHSRQALKSYETAWKLFESTPIERANTGVAMLQALAYVGDYPRSFEIGNYALEVFEEHGETLKAARIRANIANTLHRLDRYVEAKELYEGALPVLAEHRAEADLAIVMRNFGVCLMGLQLFEQAQSMYEQARKIFEESENGLLALEIDLNRAYLLGRRGMIREALAEYRSLRDRLPEDSSFEIGHCLLDQADFMVEVGLYTGGVSASADAARIFTRIGANFELGKARLVQASGLLKLGKVAEALPLLQEAKPLIRSQPNQNWRALFSLVEADAFIATDDVRRAFRAIRSASKLEATPERQVVLSNRLIDLSLQVGDFETAADTLENRPEPYLQSKFSRLTLDSKSAAKFARSALAKYDRDRSSMGSFGLRRSIAKAQEQSLRECFRSLTEPTERLAVVTRLKDQSLTDVVTFPQGRLISQEIAKLKILGGESKLLIAQRELETLTEAALTTSTPLKVTDPTHRFLEFFIDSGEVFAFQIDSDATREHRLGPVAELVEIAKYFQLNRTRFSESGTKLVNRALERLGEFLAPTLGACPEHLTIGRAGPLMTLPVHAAILNGRNLIEDHSVAYAPSSSVWSALRARVSEPSEGVLIAGAPDELAPLIAREVIELCQLHNTKALSNVQEIEKQIPTAELIHLAAHGLLREDQPIFSAMKLADRDWTVFDVLQLHLNARVTVLSGCSTGVSQAGEWMDTQGFVEALLAAGSQCVIASLWDAADEPTLAWMLAFHSGLKTGSPSSAYKQAWLSCRERWPHPGHWAAFAMFGKTF